MIGSSEWIGILGSQRAESLEEVKAGTKSEMFTDEM